MHEGPFQFAATVYTGSDNDVSLMGAPWRMNATRFDENDHTQVSVVCDMEHARSLVMGKQTASQFGYGVYDITVQARVSTNALNPDSTEAAGGAVVAKWVHPTPLRMKALQALKALERLDDKTDPFTTGTAGEAAPAANPLLSIDVDLTEAGAETLENPRSIARGHRIIRFGWSDRTPLVCRQSALTVNLNSDNDVSDNFETQHYVLTGGDEDHFGILPRFEHSLNPVVDDSGQRLVQESWAYPTCSKMVDTLSTQIQPLAWAVEQDGTNIITSEFRGVTALGGLVQLDIPEWVSKGIGNNDFDLFVSVRARRWVPM